MVSKKASKKHVESYVQACPRCKSTYVYRRQTNPLEGALGLPAWYHCDNCEWSGDTLIEIAQSKLSVVQRTERNRKKKYKDADMENMSYGIFEVHVLWKLTGPALLILGLALTTKYVGPGLGLAIIGGFMSYITYVEDYGKKQ